MLVKAKIASADRYLKLHKKTETLDKMISSNSSNRLVCNMFYV